MKKFLKRLAKVILILLLIWVVIILAFVIVRKYREHRLLKGFSGGVDFALAKDYEEEWKQTASDIAEMSLWDKYKMGLAVNNGSDTDGDGLSDKEEIEKYHSDPLKVSTSGDLYSDAYKIQNGMDVNEYYQYESAKEYALNECPEVILDAVSPNDFYAVVKDETDLGELAADSLYKQYRVYNYSGKLGFDVTDILDKHSGIKAKDIAIFVSDGDKVKKYSYTADGNTLTLKKNLDGKQEYVIMLVKSGIKTSAAIKFGRINPMKKKEKQLIGEGLIYWSPIMSWITGKPMTVYYEQFFSQEDTNLFKQNIVNYIGEADYCTDDSLIPATGVEIKMRYEVLKNIVPFFDVTSGDIGWLNFIFMYFSYKDVMNLELAKQYEQSMIFSTGFNGLKDELPFANFKSKIGTDGNCAGISHLTAVLYNTGHYDSKGAYGSEIKWNISGESGNATLMDKELYDFKTKDFNPGQKKSQTDQEIKLSSGEEEFVKMIGAAYLEGNEKANYIYTYLYGGENSTIECDYALIDSMTSRLQKGKILDAYFMMTDGTGHSMNIIGYSQDESNPDVIWFDIYDSNLPHTLQEDYDLSDEGTTLKVTKKLKRSGKGYTFSYEYYPLNNSEYGTTSNRAVIKNPCMIVMDENWNILND